MKQPINKQRLTNLLKGIQKSIDLFESQGHTDVYFTAQFLRGGRKQNGIERGDVASFAHQIRTYVFSEEADSVRIEFIDDSTSKTIYSKVLSDLRNTDSADLVEAKTSETPNNGLSGYNGLGEAVVNDLVDRRVNTRLRDLEFEQLSKEAEQLRTKIATLVTENEELEAKLKAKKDVEYFMGVVGAAFPGLAPLFSGTPLAQAAGFLAGTNDLQGNPQLPPNETDNGEAQSIAAMIGEFCNTLNAQESSAIHLLFLGFEKDKILIQKALNHISSQPPEPK